MPADRFGLPFKGRPGGAKASFGPVLIEQATTRSPQGVALFNDVNTHRLLFTWH